LRIKAIYFENFDTIELMSKDYFDPSFLVPLFAEVLNDSEDSKSILANLALCTHPVSYCRCGCGSPYFIDPKSSGWKFKTNVDVWYEGKLYVLDLMQDLRIGFIEILEDFSMPLEDMTEIQID
jgi:hypothetical protein